MYGEVLPLPHLSLSLALIEESSGEALKAVSTRHEEFIYKSYPLHARLY